MKETITMIATAPLMLFWESCMAMCFLADHVTCPEGMWRCVRWTCLGAQCYTGTDGLSQEPKQHGTEGER